MITTWWLSEFWPFAVQETTKDVVTTEWSSNLGKICQELGMKPPKLHEKNLFRWFHNSKLSSKTACGTSWSSHSVHVFCCIHYFWEGQSVKSPWFTEFEATEGDVVTWCRGFSGRLLRLRLLQHPMRNKGRCTCMAAIHICEETEAAGILMCFFA